MSRRPDTAFELSTQRRPLPAPPGGPLIVHVVVNVEHWPFDQAMPRSILPAPHGRQAVPDVPNFSWLEYGLRCGLPRVISLLEEHDLPASVSMNASVIDAYPAAAEAILAAGWEPIGHGLEQRSLQSVDDEALVVRKTLDQIEQYFGNRPRGWLGPGLQETFDTATVLRRSGVDYVFDWVFDDLPVWLGTEAGPLIAMPYGLELNDSVLHAVEHQRSDAMYVRLLHTLEALEPELRLRPHVLTLALHPHLMGVPHRIIHLRRALEELVARSDAVFMTGSAIADWFRSVSPSDGTSV